jgi:outer membrane receptor protein involved in Fe transport
MKIWLQATAVLAAGVLPPAHAQEPRIIAPSYNAANNPTYEDLIVTGEKFDRFLHETPTSVAIATTRSIVDQNLSTVYDVLDRTSNVVVDGSRTSFSIRGIDAFSVSGSGDGALASVYVDGAAIPRLALASGPLDLFDVAQVEVFRGPQSTIQGRNAIAGTVIVKTADPGFEWTGKVQLLLSDNDGQRQAGVAIGGPIAEDQVAFRLAGKVSRDDGLIRNVTTGSDADQQRSGTFRGKLLLTPRALPGLQIVGTFLYDRHQRGTFYGELDPPYDPRERIAISDIQDIKRGASSIGTLAIGYDTGAGSSFKSVTNYSRIRFRSLSDADRTALPGQISRIDDPSRTFQQDVRLNFHRSWVDGLVGAFYLRERRAYFYTATQNISLASLGIDRQLRAAGLPQATVDAMLSLYYGGALPIRNSLSQPRLTENYAGYTDLAFPLSSRWRLRFGLRYDFETQERRATQIVATDQPLPDPANLAVPALAPFVIRLNDLLRSIVRGANRAEPIRQTSYRAWLPKLGVTYDLANDVVLSLTVQRGYRAGGSSLNEQRAEISSFGPEYTTSYECGVRSKWLDNRLVLNANAYLTDWKDQQVSVQLTPDSIYDTQIINAGKSRLHGFELEMRSLVTKTLNLYAGVGFSRAKFRDFNVDVGTLSGSLRGKDFPRAPRWTLSGGATFSNPSGLFANFNANHHSAYYQGIVDQSIRDISGRTLVNAKLGWQGRHLSAFLVASNIFNAQKVDQFFSDIDGRRRGTLNAPRILGLTFESQF